MTHFDWWHQSPFSSKFSCKIPGNWQTIGMNHYHSKCWKPSRSVYQHCQYWELAVPMSYLFRPRRLCATHLLCEPQSLQCSRVSCHASSPGSHSHIEIQGYTFGRTNVVTTWISAILEVAGLQTVSETRSPTSALCKPRSGLTVKICMAYIKNNTSNTVCVCSQVAEIHKEQFLLIFSKWVQVKIP